MIIRTLNGRKMVLCLIAVLIPLAVQPSSTAMAAWTAGGPGSAAGAATVMPTGAVPSGSATGTSVKVTWAAATFPSGGGVAGYVINRYNATNGAPATVGSGCSGVIATTTCTELAVPAGNWMYTDTPVQVNWTGSSSPDSAPIVVT